MICPVCKREYVGRPLVCAFCGAELPVQNPNDTLQKSTDVSKHSKTSKKIFAVILAAFVLGIALIAAFTLLFNGKNGDYIFVEQEVAYFQNEADNRYTVFVNGEALDKTIPGNAFYEYFSSLDNRIILLIGKNYDKSFYYLLNGKELTELENSDQWFKVEISDSGRKIAYTVLDGLNQAQSLYLYDVREGTSALIDTGHEIHDIVLSPDGETLAYTVSEGSNSVFGDLFIIGGEDDEETTAYFFDGKNRVTLGKNITPIALSNGGSYLYVMNRYGIIELYDSQGNWTREFNVTDTLNIYFNADYTQMLYLNGNITYISENGEDGLPFFEGNVQLILPKNTKNQLITWNSNYNPAPIYDFYDLYYCCNNQIYQIRRDSEENVKLASWVYPSSITMSEDGDRIYYSDYTGNLLFIETRWGEDAPDKAVKLAEDAFTVRESVRYAVTADGSRIYYRNRNKELCSVTGDGKSLNIIADGVSEDFALGKGDILYFQKDGGLYVCADGITGEFVFWDGIFRKIGYLGYCYIQSYEEIYCTDGSEKPKMLLKTKELDYFDILC